MEKDLHITASFRALIEIVFREPRGQFGRHLSKGPLQILTCLVFVVLVGCIIIPTPEHDLLEGRGEITESDMAFLTEGKTTREDVLLRFGEPDLVLSDQRLLIYHWVVSSGYLFVGYGYSGAGGPIRKDYLFMLEFDEDCRLSRYEINGSIFASATYRIDKWTPPDNDKLRETIIIDPISEEIAQPIKLRPEVKPSHYWMGEFFDERENSHERTLVGQKKAAFGVVVADVKTSRSVISIVWEAAYQQLQAMGQQFGNKDADIVVIGKIADFSVKTSLNLLTWDAIGLLDVTLEVHRKTGTEEKITRRYISKNVSKTMIGPSAVNFEQVMRACLEDMKRQMATDKGLARLFGLYDNGN